MNHSIRTCRWIVATTMVTLVAGYLASGKLASAQVFVPGEVPPPLDVPVVPAGPRLEAIPAIRPVPQDIIDGAIILDGGFPFDFVPGGTPEALRKRFREDFQLRVQHVHRVAKLRPAQLKKLTVGVEGIVETMVEKGGAIRLPDEAIGVDFGDDVEADLAAGAGQVAIEQIVLPGDANGVNIVDFEIHWDGRGFAATKPRAEQRLWDELVAKVLDEEQQKLVEAEADKRASRERAYQVRALLHMLDEKLFLTETQLKEFQRLIDEHVGADIEKRDRQGLGGRPPHLAMLTSIPTQQMRKHLTEEQLAIYQRFVEPPRFSR